ncbi:hypothetical protein TIFTF001_004937 [Ficus carica]|uniref:MADS-box domain-containing protein n=1 Tax=Ficus carica TaxID=3494 RepID=A0AA88CYP0_FICCA|nr:hypothetical protein TIFTF001_004937 [Ficus carica]
MPKRSLDTLMMAEEGGSNSRKPNSLFVSFSKRREGLFRKAAKLCHLFDGTQVAVLVLSPTGNPFALGHSSVDNVLHRYYLGQKTMPNTTHPLMITTTTMSEKHRYQAQQVEILEARVKQAQNIRDCTSASLRELKAWIDKAWESCKTVEELEFLKEKYLALLESIRSRLILTSSSSSSYGEEKGVETNATVVEPLDNYVLDFTDKYCNYMAADTFFQLAGGDHSSYVDHVFCDVGPPTATSVSENDMSYSLQKFGDGASYGDGTVIGLLDSCDFDDQYLISSTGFDHGNAGFDDCVGMEGNTAFFAGESSSANVSSHVRPLEAIRPSNDMSFHSMEEFGYPNCGSYNEMGGVSYDQVFNYIDDQVPTLYFDGFETDVFDRKN